ncbi:MFS transporter [Streptomyces sp. NBC_01142]|uniref:MFS transporter n=1 Tax=Streptomyces sp. NBC_01142 TaxID=2975865 RepID=UPI00225ACEEC|nr:MFS transporter [Streptomyces sp. NBC_01142]MCX4823105.1 MFS transporter [Streptomyces sp. NBC_01142]
MIKSPQLAVLTVAFATFCVVTTEMLPVGLLSPIAAGMRVSDGAAGLTVTLPGLVAAVAAPVLTVVTGKADRRTVLCALTALLAAANLLSALAPSFAVLLAARVLVGVCIGGVWAIAAGLAVRLVPEESAGRATAVIFSGIAVASVLGVPAGTLMGELADWRAAFAATGVLALVLTVLLAAALPPLPAAGPVPLGAVTGLFAEPRIRAGLLVVLLLVTGHFAAYTYVRPVLERVDGIGAGLIGGLLLAYGGAGIAGNFAAGAAAARAPRRTLLALAAALGAVMMLLLPAGGSLVATSVLLVGWGLAYGGVSVSTQNLLTAAAPTGREAVSALFVGVFNVAIALGALLGGRAVDAFTVTAAPVLGGVLAALAAVVLLLSRDRTLNSTSDSRRKQEPRDATL